MEQLKTINALRECLAVKTKAEIKIALVPTMGNLHKGHLALVKKAQSLADYVVVSIFVNPTQFVVGEDFENYPRTLERDLDYLRHLNVDLVFIPNILEIYPDNVQITTEVIVPELDAIYCGEYRPGHFKGVATVVCKLFNIIQPDIAVFGEKDYQQLLVIRSLVKNLNLPIRIYSVPTFRETDGLAVSSRNKYLSLSERQTAPLLFKAIIDVADSIKRGESDYENLEKNSISSLMTAGFRPEYFSICDSRTLKKPVNQELVIMASAWLGKARLIDNITL
ncbi:MAG: pantoate--beta-alanine ligase [Legionellales bacterium]|nr:pantoate--beta-alanine ligase [Legionellales bacterium]